MSGERCRSNDCFFCKEAFGSSLDQVAAGTPFPVRKWTFTADEQTDFPPSGGGGTNPKDLVGAKKLPVLSVVSSASILGEAEAMQNGAEKYGAFNYREKAIQAMTYIDANQRHIMAWVDGEELAPDSNIHHLKHAKATLGILIDAIEHGGLIDNRPKGNGAAARILAANDRSGK